MYKELHIEYTNPDDVTDSITLTYKLNDLDIAQRWAARLDCALKHNIPIDHPGRFYGFDSEEVGRKKAVEAINNCCEIIDAYKPGFVGRRVDENHIDQDTLNYLHDIFEQFHGTLNTPHKFYIEAPDEVKRALAQLNLEVHRCEGFVVGSERKMLPAHMVTYYGLEKGSKFTLKTEDYEHFTDFYQFGTVYLLYTEVGKTLQDLALDHDEHAHEDAYKPFRHYSADFIVRMYSMSHQSWLKFRKIYKKHYDENKEYYLNKGYDYSHPYNRPGNIPLATLTKQYPSLMDDLAKRQWVKTVALT